MPLDFKRTRTYAEQLNTKDKGEDSSRLGIIEHIILTLVMYGPLSTDIVLVVEMQFQKKTIIWYL